MPNPTASLLYISRTVRARITKFYRRTQAGLTYIGAGYDVTTHFRSEATAKKLSKMPPPAASGRIAREWFKRGSPNFTRLSGTIGPRNLPDMTSLVTSGLLWNAIKYCTKVMRKTGLARQRVKYCIKVVWLWHSPGGRSLKKITYCYTVVFLPDE